MDLKPQNGTAGKPTYNNKINNIMTLDTDTHGDPLDGYTADTTEKPEKPEKTVFGPSFS
jgi:hypothetical protein